MPDFTVVTVTESYEQAPGIPSTGVVTFTLSHELTNNSSWNVFSATPFACRLVNGVLTAPLIAVDDSTTIPTGVVWEVTEVIDDITYPSWSFSLSTAQAPSVALHSLTPASPVSAMVSYATQAALAALAATVAGMETTAWQAATAYPAEAIVSNGTGLYQAPSGGVPARATFTSADWDHIADIGAGVLTFNTRAGAVTLLKTDVTATGLAASDVGADATGAAAAVQANLTTEVTRAEAAEALAAQKSANLSDLASESTARTNLGLGTAATHASTDFDAAGAAAAAAAASLALAGGTMSGNIAMGANRVTGGVTPVSSSEFVIKSYVDAAISGLESHLAAQWATVGTETFTIVSGSVTTINGTTLDGGSPAINDRVLIKNAPGASGVGSSPNTSQAANGLYVVTGNTTNLTLSRATDQNTGAQVPGAFVFVESGTANTGAGFTVAGAGPYTVGTTAIQWTQFSGAGEVTVDSTLTKAGNQISRAAITGDTAISAGSNVSTTNSVNGVSITGTAVAGKIPIATSGSASAWAVISSSVGTNLTGIITGNGTVLGSVAAPTGTVVGTTDTQTLTNKRDTQRAVAVTQSATPTLNTDTADVAVISGLAQAITSMTTNLTGTPANDGDVLIFKITDNGTARAITWGAKFEASGTIALPITTVISALLTVAFQWNVVTSKWRCVGVA